MLLQVIVKKQSLLASIAMVLIVGILFNFLPSVSEAHSQKETYYSYTTTTVYGWVDRKNPETGEAERVFVPVSQTSTSTSSESEVPHTHTDWSKVITATAAVITAVAAVYAASQQGK